MPTPSLLIVPARFKTGKLYSQIPTSGGDFTVTRATAATRVNASGYIDSVASGIPRLDYFASGGTVGCPALLVEPSGSNGILNSTDTTTSWALGVNLTSGAIDVIGVSGNNLTVAVSGSLGSNNSVLRRTSNNVALASGSTFTISFLMKQTSIHTVGGYYAVITGAASGDLAAGFNVSGSFSSGSIYNTAGTTNRIRRVEQWGTDVFRCSETFTMTASGTLTQFALAPVSSTTSANSPVVGSQIGFAAPQIELGSVPTSFIPTLAAAVTRNAEVITVSGAVSGSIGQTEGTIYAEAVYSSIASTKTFVAINDGTVDNRIALRIISTTSISATVVVAGVSHTISATIPAIPSSGVVKIALGYKANDYALAINGTIYPFTTTRPVPPTTAAFLGNNGFNSDYLNDRIRAVALYTTRLSNAQLAALTSP